MLRVTNLHRCFRHAIRQRKRMFRLPTGFFRIRLASALRSIARNRLVMVLRVFMCLRSVFFFKRDIHRPFIRYRFIKFNVRSGNVNFRPIPSYPSNFLGMHFKEIKGISVRCSASVELISTRTRDINNCRSTSFSILPTFLPRIFCNVIRSNVVRINNGTFLRWWFNSFFNTSPITSVSGYTTICPFRSV